MSIIQKKVFRILVADDHSIILEGIKSLLKTDSQFIVVGATQSGEQVLSLVKTHHPDIIILDLSMPSANGLDIIRKIDSRFPAIKTIVYTVHAAPQKLHEALMAGVQAYVLKGDPHTNLLTALRCVLEGHCYLSPNVCKTLIESYLQAADNHPPQPHSNLSFREQEVLNQVAQGLTDKQIALSLSISPRTVTNHIYRLKKKLDLHKRAQLILYASQHLN